MRQLLQCSSNKIQKHDFCVEMRSKSVVPYKQFSIEIRMQDYAYQNFHNFYTSTTLRRPHQTRFRLKQSTEEQTYSRPHYIHRNQPQDKFCDSFQTCESDTPETSSQKDHHHEDHQEFHRNNKSKKLKVELCRNYIEKGYCPYEGRCKFAHGVEELRAKDTCGTSELYRTRKCKVFFEKKECKFGERCNFLHENRNLNDIHSETQRKVKESMRMNFKEIVISQMGERGASRLMQVLGCPCEFQ